MEENGMNGENNLNNLDNRINDRGFFERILKEFKDTLTERDKGLDDLLAERNLRLDERFAAQKDAVDKAFDAQTEAIRKAEVRLDGTLKGFPQEYARRMELEQMIAALDETSTVLAQKVVDSAKALAEAQVKADDRVDVRIKKLEDFQAQQTADLARDFVTKQTLSALSDKLAVQIDRNRDDVVDLTNRINIREGEVSGSRLTYGNIAALIGVFATILGVIIVLANVLTN